MQALKKVALLICFLALNQKANFAQQKEVNTSSDLYEWVENKGQWHEDIYFRCRQHALDLQIGTNFIRYYFFDEAQLNRLHEHGPVKAKPLPQDTS
jgi:hypothetical protein